MPALQINPVAQGKVALETGRHGLGQRRIERFKVGFEVETQIPVIEVARTDADPIIDQDHFQVQKTRLVFEDLHAGAQQARVIAMPGITHRRVVGAWAG
ncbi:hypothetical protein D3C86_1877030 [compost metagenome]